MRKSYCRVMLGQGSVYAAGCFDGGFVGADFGIEQDLSGKLPDQWREFNKEFIPVFLDGHPVKSRISAGLACGALWTVGFTSNWGPLVEEFERRVARADGVVVNYLMRINFGRTVRKLCHGKPWRSCDTRGRGKMAERILAVAAAAGPQQRTLGEH